MIVPNHNSRIYLSNFPVDFRFGFDRLALMAKQFSDECPYEGAFFVFFNRSYTRAKVIYSDGNGSCMLWKRLESGNFKPKISSSKSFATLEQSQLSLLLEGVDYSNLRKPKSWLSPGKSKK